MYSKSPFDPRAWLYSKFPEELYPCRADLIEEYNERILAGLKVMGQSEVSICGLVRNLAHILPLNIYRIEHIASLFAFAKIYVYENDSTDGTVDILKDWAKRNPQVKFQSETIGYAPLIQNRSQYRTERMAAARNKLLALAREDRTHYVLLIDADIKGGVSPEGLAHSFSFCDELKWDMMGSNGIIMQPSEDKTSFRPLFYDSWAYREWDLGPHEDCEINLKQFFRGEYPIKLHSNFGGCGLYRWESLMDLEYNNIYADGPLKGQSDCEHCIVAYKMRQLGRDKIYLNPSQICLYDYYRFENIAGNSG